MIMYSCEPLKNRNDYASVSKSPRKSTLFNGLKLASITKPRLYEEKTPVC
jgi:hypothetical protein